MKILVLDDETKIQGILKGRLEMDGHEVFTAESGEAGLAIINEHQPNLLLLDLSLKGKLSGRDVLAEVKKTSPQVHVVVVTGYVEAESEEFQQLGASGLLKKPLNLADLDAIVKQLGNSSQPAA
ncbi:MAG: response regulator [Candidatus Omnitrophota bacterium]|nr:response regulator [Candidatus Omnitrophota bacterium]